MEADFHGLRPVRRLRRMMPRDQTSLNRGEYEPLWANCPPWHSENDGFVSETEKRKAVFAYLGSCDRRCLFGILH
jgi:hypothetical protein